MQLVIRLCRASAVTAPLAARYRALLTAPEARRVDRLPTSRQTPALLARALARAELAAVLDREPSALDFASGRHGKPFLSCSALPFNLSHAGDWVVLAHAMAEAPALALGVDIEEAGARRDVLRVARRYFAGEEVGALVATSGEAERERRFRDLWTLKEAAVKARGEALAPNLATAAFAVDRAAGSIRTLAGAADPGALWLWEPAPGVTLALCARGGAVPAVPRCLRGLPLAGWEPAGDLLPCAAGPARADLRR